MAIKKLQNNFTTPEQSKRLLKLGVPADSADMFYYTAVAEYPRIRANAYGHISNEHSIPCWSVGRLIEISELCYTSLFEHDYFIRQKDCNTDFLIKMFELGADRMDFSKLEE